MNNCYYADAAQIKKLRQLIADAKLNVPDGFEETSIENLQKCYNGIGPQAWSICFRSYVTRILNSFEPEALIHDWEYTYSPKQYCFFTIANVRFLLNGIKYSFYLYGLNSRTLKQVRLALILALLCQLFGWSAYRRN